MPADSLTAAVYSLLTIARPSQPVWSVNQILSHRGGQAVDQAKASGQTAREPWGMGGMIRSNRPTLMGLTPLMALSTPLLHGLP
jgi:hypothetical protein